ncbi:hypothetical protein PFISCL1PPCAC_6242, partial [Pristionchus fissidentatus]
KSVASHASSALIVPPPSPRLYVATSSNKLISHSLQNSHFYFVTCDAGMRSVLTTIRRRHRTRRTCVSQDATPPRISCSPVSMREPTVESVPHAVPHGYHSCGRHGPSQAHFRSRSSQSGKPSTEIRLQRAQGYIEGLAQQEHDTASSYR